MKIEIINTAWMSEIQTLVKSRITALECALERAKEENANLNETETEYTWTNHMGTVKRYSKEGVASMKEFVRMYEAGELNTEDWDSKVTYTMWVEIALALYYVDVKTVHAGITFVDVRRYIFNKIAK
ncbi:MAG: hypothetical protein MJZ13_06655 [Bacteroidales bacterium]|nr:hypothetical protein [Bacteroidales bacterium]